MTRTSPSSSPLLYPAVTESPTTPQAMTRREMLVTTLASGFALAVQPVSAQTVHTDSQGLSAGEIKIPVSDGSIPGYQARPEGAGPFPVILVVQEIFGVHEHIKDLCRRLAKQGYLAVAPELYARQGDVSKLDDIAAILPIVYKVPDAQVMADLDATADWAKNSGHGDTARLGVTGFCWGGRIVWLYAAHNPQLKAGVAWYGRLDGKTSELQPQHPLQRVGALKAPVLGLYAGKDQGIPLSDVEAMRAALKTAAVPCEIKVYADADHGFNADYRPSYSPDAAKDGWQRMLAWFSAHGLASAR